MLYLINLKKKYLDSLNVNKFWVNLMNRPRYYAIYSIAPVVSSSPIKLDSSGGLWSEIVGS